MEIKQETFKNVKKEKPQMPSSKECLAAYWYAEQRITHTMANVIPAVVLISIIQLFMIWYYLSLQSAVVLTIALTMFGLLLYTAGRYREKSKNQALLRKSLQRLIEDQFDD